MSDGRESVATESLPPGLALLDDPVFCFDQQGSLAGWNDALAEQLGPGAGGLDRDEVEYDRAQIERIAAGECRGESVTVSVETGDGERAVFDVSLTPLPADEPGAVVGVGHEVERASGDHASAPDETELAARERALRRAYEIVGDTERSLDEKIHDLLSIVRETIGVEFATLARVDGDQYHLEAVDTPQGRSFEGPDGTLIQEGETVPLSFTTCERVVEQADTLVAPDLARDAPDLAERPGNAETGVSCYIGTPVVVGAETYGTVCFYDRGVRTAGFSDWEVTFVELLGNWVSNELDRERLLGQVRAEERQRYETVVEQSREGIVIVQDGEFVFTNDRFLELTGREREAVLGMPFEELLAPEYREVVTDRYEERMAGESAPSRYDVEVETASGASRTLDLTVSRIEYEGEPAAMATLHDITERVRRERAVQTLQEAARSMQTASTRDEVAEIATDAARESLDLPFSVCWFEDETGTLSPVAATEPAYEEGYVEPLGAGQYEYEAYRDGTVTRYSPTERGDDLLETGLLLPLGEHGLLAAGRPEPTEHDEMILDVARTLTEHTRVALDRIERTQDLERSQARFRALTENTTYGVVTIDPTSTVQFASEGIEDVFGYTPAELEGESLLAVIPERLQTPHEEAFTRYLEEGKKHLDWSWIELPGQHKEGHEVPLGISFGETTVDGEKRFSAVIRDITEQKERQEELREERAFTESVFAALPDVFYAFDEFGNFLRWNDQLEAVTGYTGEEIEAMHPTEFVAPEDRDTVVEAIAAVFEEDTTVTVEASFETKGGEQIPYEFTGAKLVDETGNLLGLVGIGRDISDRKERQRRFEAVFNNTYQFTGLMEPDGTIIEANDTALEFGELRREEVIGEKLWDAYWFRDAGPPEAVMREAVEQAADGEFVRREVTVRGSDREAIIDFSLRPVTDDDGTVTLLIPEGRDITELKAREEELRRERDHVRRTEELADVGGWELDVAADSFQWTQGTRRLHDVDDEFEPTVEEALEFVHPDDRESVGDAVDACRETGEPFDIEARIVTAAGRTRWVRIEGDRVTDNGTEMLRGVMGDITERKEREQRLMVLNRVLRHNLRNKLTVVSGYAEALDGLFDGYESDGSMEVDRARDHTAKIRESATELVELGEKARQFEQAIEGTAATTTVDVVAMLGDIAGEYRDAHPDATIEVQGANQQFTGHVEFLTLAVEELVDNAVTHSEDTTPTVEIRVSEMAGDQFEVAVVDNGPGIPGMEAEILTEGEETSLLHGSGVGLWTVNWLVTRIGGQVSIAESDSPGTVVTLTVPEESE